MIVEEAHPLWLHLEDLRSTLIKVMATLAIGMLVSFSFSSSLIQFLTSPYQKKTELQSFGLKRIYNDLSTPVPYRLEQGNRMTSMENYSATTVIPAGQFIEILVPINEDRLVILSPLDGMLASIKVSFWSGFILTAPLWGWFFFCFAAPALHPHEVKLLFPFLSLSLLAIAIGGIFAWNITIPLANEYLMLWNQRIGMNLWGLQAYLDYTLFLVFANCIATEIAVIGLFLVHFGAITAEWMIQHRKGATVCAFILGAVLTPPDILTQLLLAIPLIAVYEALILYARARKRALLNADVN